MFYSHRKKLSSESWLFLAKESCTFSHENTRRVKSPPTRFNSLECLGMSRIKDAIYFVYLETCFEIGCVLSLNFESSITLLF